MPISFFLAVACASTALAAICAAATISHEAMVVGQERRFKNISFGLLHYGSSDFFPPVHAGFQKKCNDTGVNLHCITTEYIGECKCHCTQLAAIEEFIDAGVDGIAMDPCDEGGFIIDKATAPGIAVVTFDSDMPDSTRVAHVGTDNAFLGRTMARLLRQLRPEGGTFAIIGNKKSCNAGFVEEITKDNDRDDRAHWYEVENTEIAVGGNVSWTIWKPTHHSMHLLL